MRGIGFEKVDSSPTGKKKIDWAVVQMPLNFSSCRPAAKKATKTKKEDEAKE